MSRWNKCTKYHKGGKVFKGLKDFLRGNEGIEHGMIRVMIRFLRKSWTSSELLAKFRVMSESKLEKVKKSTMENERLD